MSEKATSEDNAYPRFLPLGDSGIAVEFGNTIDLSINSKVLALEKSIAAELQQGKLQGIIETVPAYCTLTVVYDPLQMSYGELVASLQEMTGNIKTEAAENKDIVEIPVVYGGEYGPDLGEVAERCGLEQQEVIARHAAVLYPVYMLGFVAGFPYLGGMDQSLATPRKKSPRLKIPAGSVGIAGSQTGIYSVESPGGWQIIGRTYVKLYDAAREKPALLSAGQYVKFVPIAAEEYELHYHEH